MKMKQDNILVKLMTLRFYMKHKLHTFTTRRLFRTVLFANCANEESCCIDADVGEFSFGKTTVFQRSLNNFKFPIDKLSFYLSIIFFVLLMILFVWFS